MRKKAMALLPVIILALLVSCDGSGSDSTEGTNFSTVSASASFDLGVMVANVAVWVDTDGNDTCDLETYFADDATIKIEALTDEKQL